MSVTMKDIGKKCEVSQTVVSFVLNGRDSKVGISRKTHDLVLKTAKEMGYCRNELAVSIVKKRSKVLAFVSAEMGSVEYSGRIQNGIFAEANGNDYAVSVFHLSADNSNSEEILRKIIGLKMEGVIFHVSDVEQVSFLCEELKHHRIPYGFVNLSCPDGIGITTDDYEGAKQAVRHLWECGCRKIIFLTHFCKEREYLQKRLAGYLDGMKECLPSVRSLKAQLKPSDGLSVVCQIQEILRKKKPDGVFCVGDDLGMRAEAAAIGLGLRIPEDLAVVGYGNLQMGEFATVPLTTIDQDYEAMGRFAVSAVLKRRDRNMSSPISLLLPAKLLVRDSTIPKKGGRT